jgi:Domain of unknown function (DUF4431)
MELENPAMRVLAIFQILTLLLLGVPDRILGASPRERVLHYDPSTEEVVGTIETQTFAGPPGYDSIKSGDEIETGWYLRLADPVTVLANHPTTDLGWKTERHTKVIQMVIDYNKIPEKTLPLGGMVTVKGKLFNRQTGHHHSRVLVDVIEIKMVKK